MRVLVTGSRIWRDKAAIRHEMVTQWNKAGLEDMTLVHGGQRSWDRERREAYGADYLAGKIAQELDWMIEEFPADWQTHGRAAGPIRNALMVAAGADVCLGFPTVNSRGTWDCMRRAHMAGIPVIIRTPAMSLGVPWYGQ